MQANWVTCECTAVKEGVTLWRTTREDHEKMGRVNRCRAGRQGEVLSTTDSSSCLLPGGAHVLVNPHLLESGCWRQCLLLTTITVFKRKCPPHFLLGYFRESLWLIFHKTSPEEARPRAWASRSTGKELLGTEKAQTPSRNCQSRVSAHRQAPSGPSLLGNHFSGTSGAAQGQALT